MPPKGEAPRTGFHGILAYLRDNTEEARSDSYREYMMNYMTAAPCPGQSFAPPFKPQLDATGRLREK